ncbi:MAG TPA: phosphatidylinositol mannoside acyltransferase, partial [Micromonosporaceae bacterium]|nr:phosphatidylinositol mannoside acyltransferase [Micromonosporaceae bacterium]
GYMHGPLELPGPEAGSLDQRVRLFTQQVADELGRGIAANPADWHMLQKLWLTEPPVREA